MAKETLQEIDKLANLYNKTKDDKYKILWYKKIQELLYMLRFFNDLNRENKKMIKIQGKHRMSSFDSFPKYYDGISSFIEWFRYHWKNIGKISKRI